MRRLLLVPLALLLVHCGENAVKPQPGGSNAGTNAGNGSTGQGSATTTGSSTTTGSTTSSGTSTTASNGSGSTGVSTSAGSGSTGVTTSAGSGSSGVSTSSGSGSTGVASTSAGSSGSSGTTATTAASGSSGTTTTTGTTGASGSSGGSTGSVPQGFVRVADVVSGASGISIDFCTRVTGATTWSAPVLGALGGSLSSPGMTLYFGFDDPSGNTGGTNYDYAVILAGTNACGLSTNTGTFTVVANTHKTLVASGQAASPDFTVLTDETATSGATQTRFRFFNASPDTNVTHVDFGLVSSNSVASNISNVPYDQLGASWAGGTFNGSIDANDYVSHDAFTKNLGVRNHSGGSATPLATDNVSFTGGTLHTLFFLGTQNSGFALTSCLDDQTAPNSTNHGTSVCQ